VGNHGNPAFGGISRIGHLDPTQRLGLRGGFKMASKVIIPGVSISFPVHIELPGLFLAAWRSHYRIYKWPG